MTSSLDPQRLAPSDARVALLSLPRRWRALLVPPEGTDEADRPDDVARRRPPDGGESALDHLLLATAALEWADRAMHDVLVRDGPEVPVEPAAAIGAGEEVALGDALDRLRSRAEGLAEAITHVDAGDWTRSGTVPGGEEVTALGLVGHAVHQGVHHLREAERVLAQVRGREADE